MAHPKSQLCHKSELDLFLAPHVQSSIERGQFIEYFPVSNITESSPIEFCVPGSGDELTDLRSSWVYIKAKITKSNGTDLEGGDKIGPVNLFLQSMFSQVSKIGEWI